MTDGDHLADKPRWSPDGRLVYYISDDDSFRCLYARRFDPASGRVAGPAWAVHHFHKARYSMNSVAHARQELSIARDRAVFTLEETSSAVWLADTQQ